MLIYLFVGFEHIQDSLYPYIACPFSRLSQRSSPGGKSTQIISVERRLFKQVKQICIVNVVLLSYSKTDLVVLASCTMCPKQITHTINYLCLCHYNVRTPSFEHNVLYFITFLKGHIAV